MRAPWARQRPPPPPPVSAAPSLLLLAIGTLAAILLATLFLLRGRRKQQQQQQRQQNRPSRPSLPHLQALLLPLSFDADISSHNSRFVEGTRQWVFHDIERWRCKSTSRCQVLLAGPGFGKSAIVARYCLLHPDAVLAVHLCSHNDARKRDPHRLVRSLAYQIAQSLPAFRSALEAEAGALHDELTSMSVRDLVDRLLLQVRAAVQLRHHCILIAF